MPYGAHALERDCDPLGRLVAARTIEGEGVFNGLEYRYDAWGAVAELRERADGEASEEYRELCGLATYEYEGPKVIGTGSTRHAIAHRPRYLRLRGPEGVFVASLYYDYGDPGTVASVLARPKREVVGLEPGEAASWAPAWRLEESYLGRSWWVKGVYEAKPEEPGPWLPELTEEVPGAYEGALDGLDRFGRPREFQASHDGSEVPLRRTYAYDASTARLTLAADYKKEGGVESLLATESYGYL